MDDLENAPCMQCLGALLAKSASGNRNHFLFQRFRILMMTFLNLDGSQIVHSHMMILNRDTIYRIVG